MGEMHETSDARLLRDYADHGDEAAFREIVNRHAGLVYAAAWRQVASPDLARDVAQSVFTDLARKASTLAATLTENASLLGWLHRSTRFSALNQLRDDRRRLARERQVMQDLDPASAPAPDWNQLQPVLDEAMADLSGEDRDALLLRFFKNQDFRDIGSALGVSDDTAQKRVSRALEKLRTHLASRGVTTSALALSTAISVHAAPAAPAGLAAALASGALAGTAIAATATATVLKTIAMTTLQKTLITAALAVAVGTGIYEARQAAQLREQDQVLREQQTSLAQQLQQLQRERAEATNRLAELQDEMAKVKSNNSELLKLRGEVTRLKNKADDPTQLAAKSWLNRVSQLKQRLEQTPTAKIPELHLLNEEDWLAAVKDRPLDSDNQYRLAMSSLRTIAEAKFAHEVFPALQKYLEANENKFPMELGQLQDYFGHSIDSTILERWMIAPANTVPAVGVGDQIITERSAVDDVLDTRMAVGANGSGSGDFLDSETRDIMQQVYQAYSKANNGNWSGFTKEKLLPFAQTPAQQAAVKKVIEQNSIRQE